MRHVGILAECTLSAMIAAAVLLAAASPVQAREALAKVGSSTGDSTTSISAADSGSADASSARGAPQWAAWITRDVEINFQDLPSAYSCDALWYKLRGVLLAIGARKYMSIMPYDCGKGAAQDGRSPTVDLRFQTLRELTGASARWAETKAVRKAVTLGPGLTQHLEPGDCSFLEQLEGALFPYLGMPVVSQHFDCSAASGGARYGVTVQAIIEHPIHSPKS